MIRVSDIAQWNDRQKRATAGTGFYIYDKAAFIKPLILKALDEEDHSIFDRLRKNFFPTGYPVLITKIQKGVSTGRANKTDLRRSQVTENTFGLAQDVGDEDAWQFSVSRSSHGRVHGFLIDEVFYIRWLDPEHNLDPGAGK